MAQFRALVAALVAVILVGAAPVSAAEWKDYSPEALAQAQAEGKPILIDVFAPWCSVCRAQNPILTQLTREPKYKDLVVLKADFDTQKEQLKPLNVRSQSTLIVFKDGLPQKRLVGAKGKGQLLAELDEFLP